MGDATATTPGSSTAKGPAVKDKECPYCHQAFTSSSLGRHLDLYIKSKNAKPPDNLHNVEEIRQLRGNVTRRQARTSSGKRDRSTPSSSKHTPLRDQRSPSIQGGSYIHQQQSQHADSAPLRTYLNKPTWHATGVINDIPSITNSAPYSRAQSPSKRPSVKEDIAHKQNVLEERDRARAAESALREVLDSVNAANFRAHLPPPFQFAFFDLSFPELCLQCLSAPQSLQSKLPLPEKCSWSFETPKAAQYDLLCEQVESKLRDWHTLQEPHLHLTYNHSLNGANGDSQSPKDLDLTAMITNYKHHLANTYDDWKALPDKKKQESWLHECAKAFVQEQEKHQDTKRRLELAEQKLQILHSQLTEKGQAQWIELYPSATLPLSSETTAQLPDSEFFNYESLIAKWRTRIQSSRSTQQPLPSPSGWAAATPPNLNNSKSNGTPYPTLNQRTPYAQMQPSNGAEDHVPEEDEDLADAPGDDDDLGQQNGLDKDVLDPSLTNADVDGEGQAGRMLMGLREYVGSAGGNGPGNGSMDIGKG
ncbi:hypothetical protein ACLMJK_007951 [Lecanora helva]